MNRSRIKRFVFLMILLPGMIIGSENRKIAQTGFQFLSVIPDAVGASLAGAMTALNTGSRGLFYNPAGMATQLRRIDVSVTDLDWIAGIKHTGITLSVRPSNGKYGVIGMSVQNVNYGDLQGTMVWDNELGYIDTEVFRPTALSLGLGYSKVLNDQLSIGGQVKSAHQYLGRNVVLQTDTSSILENSSASAIAFDFGTIFSTGWKGFTFGMSVRNFSEEIEYFDESFQLPLTFVLGASINVMEVFSFDGRYQDLHLSVDASHPRSFDEQFGVGLDYVILDLIHFRLGYLGNYDQRGMAGGFGIEKSIKGIHVSMNYAYTPFGVFDSVQHLNLNIGLD